MERLLKLSPFGKATNSAYNSDNSFIALFTMLIVVAVALVVVFFKSGELSK